MVTTTGMRVPCSLEDDDDETNDWVDEPDSNQAETFRTEDTAGLALVQWTTTTVHR
jgi:hypothetical protein